MQACFAQRTRQAVKCGSRKIAGRWTGYLRELVAPHGDHHEAEEVEGAGVDGDVHQTKLRREVVSGEGVLPSVHEAYASPAPTTSHCERPP